MMTQRMVANPRGYYVAKRKNADRTLLRQTLGMLAVLGALMMIANG